MLTVFLKVDAASPRGLMAPPGLTPLGAKGSVRDRLRLPDGLRVPPRELYSIAPLGRWAPCGASINAACQRRPPLVAVATTFPPQAGAQQPVLYLELLMKKMFNGALLSTVHILHRMCKLGEVRRLACP